MADGVDILFLLQQRQHPSTQAVKESLRNEQCAGRRIASELNGSVARTRIGTGQCETVRLLVNDTGHSAPMNVGGF
jgi:hypothetical protein